MFLLNPVKPSSSSSCKDLAPRRLSRFLRSSSIALLFASALSFSACSLAAFSAATLKAAASQKAAASLALKMQRMNPNASASTTAALRRAQMGGMGAGMIGGAAAVGSKALGFLAGPGGMALAIGAAVVAFTRSVTAATDQFKGLAEAIDNVDFSKLGGTEGSVTSFADNLARAAVKAVDDAQKKTDTGLIVNPGEDMIDAFLRDA